MLIALRLHFGADEFSFVSDVSPPCSKGENADIQALRRQDRQRISQNQAQQTLAGNTDIQALRRQDRQHISQTKRRRSLLPEMKGQYFHLTIRQLKLLTQIYYEMTTEFYILTKSDY